MGLIPIVANAAAETASAFEWAGQPPKLAPSRAGYRPHIMHGSAAGPTNVTNRNTHTYTDRPSRS